MKIQIFINIINSCAKTGRHSTQAVITNIIKHKTGFAVINQFFTAEIGLWWQMTDRDWANWGLAHIEWIKTH